MTRRASPEKLLQKACAVLGRQHADDEHQRPRHALLEIGERRRDGAAAVGIVAAVEPKLALRRQQCSKPAMRQPLHARRPIDARHAGLECGGGQFQAARAQRRDRRAGIFELVAAIKPRRRQIEKPVAVLIDEPAAFFGRGPVLAGDVTAAPCSRAAWRSITASASRAWLATTAGTSRLRMPAFSAAICFDGVAEKFAVVERQAGDDARQRAFDDVGGVEPAAEPDFEEKNIGRMAREQQKRRSRLDLEHRDRRLAVLGLAFGKRLGKLGIVDQPAAARLRPMRKRSLRRTRLGDV